MKRKSCTVFQIIFFLLPIVLCSQDAGNAPPTRWNHEIETNFYFLKDEFIFLPMYSAGRDWLHLEARYNYEDVETASAWFGYNFTGGDQFQYDVTPIVGGVVGKTNGIAAGLELTFSLGRFEFYSESEYVFNLQTNEDDFFYNWTDLTYSPFDWFYVGLSAQKTRIYEQENEIQRGLLAGGSYRNFDLSLYFYNPGTDANYFILSLSASIQ